jgi:hypothetical protein
VLHATEPRTDRRIPCLALQRKEAAEALGIAVDTFDRYVKPALNAVYVGSIRLYPIVELEQWLRAHAHGTLGSETKAGRRRANDPPPAQGGRSSRAAQA